MLDYIQILRYSKALGLSSRTIARLMDGDVSKSGVNDFLKAFDACNELEYPLDPGITNEQIYLSVYGKRPGRIADPGFILPDFPKLHEALKIKNMTLTYQWDLYRRACEASDDKAYSYRQYCRMYGNWCEGHGVSLHFEPVAGQTMEVDFAGKTFTLTDPITGDEKPIVVFVAVLPFSHCIYAEGMTDTKEPEWIKVNNNAIHFFGGVPALVIPDNCKQAVLANSDWRDPEVNPTYQEWADWNRTFIQPAKVRSPKYKPAVENAVGILESGAFHDLANLPFFSLEDFNAALFDKVRLVNERPFAKKEHNRYWYLEIEQKALLPLPPTPYEYADTRTAKVHADYHVRFSNACYSVDKSHANETVTIRATPDRVRIYSHSGELLADWERATHPGEWKTDVAHMPKWYQEMKGDSEESILAAAAQVGPFTARFIEQLLATCDVPVQGFRRCRGILKYASKYGAAALEKCCADASAAGRISYNFIKTTIAGVAQELACGTYNDAATVPPMENSVNATAYTTDPGRSSVENLLAQTADLLRQEGGINE